MMDLDSSSSSLGLPVSVPPEMLISGITPVDSTNDSMNVKQLADSKQGSVVTTPTLPTFKENPKRSSSVVTKKVVKSETSVKSVKTELVGVALTRTSHRQIKRPKTDEELIDFESSSRSSGSKKAKTATKTSTPNVLELGCTKQSDPFFLSSKSPGVMKKPSTKPKLLSAVKDLGRWRPTDDIMLISAVLQTNDLAAVHLGVKFSCNFTLKEVEERWHALLYEPQISKIAVEAAKGLHPGVVTMTMNNALWSTEEEGLLAKIPSTDPGHLETFQQVLADHPTVFHQCRSATSLHHHWVLMGHYSLLSDQHVDVVPPGDNVVNFSDAEDLIIDSDLMKQRDVREEALSQESMLADRQAKMSIKKLEKDLPVWQELLNLPDIPVFESGVIAILKGRVVQYMMRTNEVTLGRNSASSQVTFDLTLEGPAYKISRLQATLKMSPDKVLTIRNEGRRPMYIGGNVVVTGEMTQLQHNQVIEIASFCLLVLINQNFSRSS